MNRSGACGHSDPGMPRAESNAPALAMGTQCCRRPRGRQCQAWPPARFPRLQRTAEAAAAPRWPWPLWHHCIHFPKPHPNLASSLTLPCAPTSVTPVCSRTRSAGRHVPGLLPHGTISPPLSPSFFPSFSRKMLQLWPFPWQQACFPHDAAEPEPCARWGRHGNSKMSHMTARGCSHEHTLSTRGDSRPHVHPHARCSLLHPWKGALNFGAGWGQSQSPPHIRVRKRMGKREEEGGFHSNCLVSRETWREMSAQSWGWSREGIESPGVMGWHRLAPRDTSVSPIMSPVPQTSTSCWGRLCLTPNSGDCDSTEALNPEPHCPSHPSHPCHGQEEGTPFVGRLPPSIDLPSPFTSTMAFDGINFPCPLLYA